METALNLTNVLNQVQQLKEDALADVRSLTEDLRNVSNLLSKEENKTAELSLIIKALSDERDRYQARVE